MRAADRFQLGALFSVSHNGQHIGTIDAPSMTAAIQTAREILSAGDLELEQITDFPVLDQDDQQQRQEERHSQR